MNTAPLISETSDDTHLVELSLRGDTRAFGSLVERHQSLICGLAYSACGNVHVSEDLAQETFIAAWLQLRTLRERGNLRGWLCGIARHVINNFLRRQQRTPTAMAAEIDDTTHPVSAEPSPDESAIQEQESAMLWRTLQTLPETYREPMVLFYRQNESVAAVAESMGLSEDAVKQRLARGRAMLAEQVERRLGNTLRRTMPTAAFTFGVLAALPLATTSASAATAGMTLAKGGASGKPLVMALLNGVLSPLLGFLAAGVGYKVSMDSARSVEEQRMIKKFFRVLLAAILFFCAYTTMMVIYGRWLALQYPTAYVALLTGMVAGCVLFCAGGMTWALRQNRKVAFAESAVKEAARLPVGKWGGGAPRISQQTRPSWSASRAYAPWQKAWRAHPPCESMVCHGGFRRGGGRSVRCLHHCPHQCGRLLVGTGFIRRPGGGGGLLGRPRHRPVGHWWLCAGLEGVWRLRRGLGGCAGRACGGASSRLGGCGRGAACE